MNTSLKTYYIPNNPNIQKGRIYTLYINNNSNLDLSSILTSKNINQITQNKTNSITISEKDYTRLLELNNLAYQLTNKRTLDIQNFLNEENKTISQLIKINEERQKLVKKLNK